MIKKVELENYRCYKKHTIEFRDLSIAVGKNNAGKSTLVEALRLISLVANRYTNLPYKTPPRWAALPQRYRGISPSLKGIEISLFGLFFKHSKPPAKITAYFREKSKIELSIGEKGELYAAVFDELGNMITNKGQALGSPLPIMNILPQVGPLKREEDLLAEDYIKANVFSSLASIHFRNQLQYFSRYFDKFKNLAENSWEGLRIIKFEKGNFLPEEPPILLIEDEGFIAEVGWAGHGLQMWLQTMWFIARCNRRSTIILDEPDVYLHADMQRKLINFLRDRFQQIIIATHSVEIISEVEPENILVINKNKGESKSLITLPAMQEIINSIGSIHNLELIRYWSSGKFLFLESNKDDIKIMKIIQDKIFSKSKNPINAIPKASTEGWTGWQKVLGASMAIKASGIKMYCIFDSDYHTQEELNKRYEEAKKYKIDIHIWNKKEIENYLIIPEAILRVLLNECTKGTPTLEKVSDKIEEISDNMKDDAIDCYAQGIRENNKALSVSTCNKQAREIVNDNWSDIGKRLSIIPGKLIIKLLSEWSKKEFNVSLNKVHITKELRVEEVDKEIKEVLDAIEK